MGFLKKLNPFDDDKQDKAEKAEKEARKAEEEAQEAAADAARAREDAQRATEDAARAESGGTAVAEETAVVVESSEGRVSGTGIYRQYTTKAGDKMEDIAAYFYGDPVHKQRLIDDNPALQTWDGRELPGGLTINVGEDPSRGDAVSTA